MARLLTVINTQDGNMVTVYGPAGDAAAALPAAGQGAGSDKYLQYTQAGFETTTKPNVFTVRLRPGVPWPTTAQDLLGTEYPAIKLSPFPYTHTGYDAPEQQTMIGSGVILFTFDLARDQPTITVTSGSYGSRKVW